MRVNIEQDRLTHELATLATFSGVPNPAVTRVVFSDVDLQARQYVKQLCAAAGLVIREDAAGNTFARWIGDAPDLAAIATGSHIDAIPSSGQYDGTVGVLGGLEAIRALQRSGFQPHRSIDLILFTSEEPTRFGVGCLGSRLLCGALEASSDQRLSDKEGRSLHDVRNAAGFSGSLEQVRLSPGCYAGFIELHIEQGPLLERSGTPVGIVTAIAAPAGLRVQIDGEGGHAGAILMPQRHDAFLAAAEIALAVEQAAINTGAIDSVATAGICDIFPGAVNSIPSHVKLELDIRDTDVVRRDGMLHAVRSAAQDIAEHRGVKIQFDIVNADDPAQCDPDIIEAIVQSCRQHSSGFQKMISRAYHDSLFVSRIAPTAMIFIPCRNGYSHRPDEYSSPAAIRDGVAVLADALAILSLRSG